MKNNFEKAYDLAKENFNLDELLEILTSSDDIKKQIAILNIEEIDTQKIADLLVFNLTNQSGPIREACAFKISEIIKLNASYFQSKKTLDTFLNAFIDVNPNVVRFMLDTIKYIKDKKYIFNNQIKRVKILYEEIINKPRRGKVEEHIFTKKCFKIYWILEVIKVIINNDKTVVYNGNNIVKDFYELIEKLSCFEEYTIREKIAQILTNFTEKEFEQIRIKLSNDESYFVKRCCK